MKRSLLLCCLSLALACFIASSRSSSAWDDVSSLNSLDELRLTPSLRRSLQRGGPPLWASSNFLKTPEHHAKAKRNYERAGLATRNQVNTEMEVRWAGVGFPHGPCPEERDRDDDDSNWRITYLAKACWRDGTDIWVCPSWYTHDETTFNTDDGNYTCFMDQTDDDDNNYIALDTYPLLINPFFRWIFRIFGWSFYIQANTVEINRSVGLTGESFSAQLLKGDENWQGGTLEVMMAAFNKQNSKPSQWTTGQACEYQPPQDQVAYGIDDGTVTIDYQAYQEGRWHYFQHRVDNDQDLDWPDCYYSFRFRWRYFERTVPVVDAAWPNGFHAPPLEYDTYTPEGDLINAQRSESVYLFGPNIIGQGVALANSGQYKCRVFGTSTTEVQGTVSQGSYTNLELTTSDLEYLFEFNGERVSDLGSELDDLEQGTDILQREYLNFYGGPPEFASGNYEGAVRCPEFLFQLAKYQESLSDCCDFYQNGTTVYLSVSWVYSSGATIEAEEVVPILLHGDFSRTHTTARLEAEQSQIFQANSIIITSRWDVPNRDGTDEPEPDTASNEFDQRTQGTDLFLVEWQDGPGLNPEFGINYGALVNNWDGTYTLPFTVDFAGTYCVLVYWVDPVTHQLITVAQEGELAQEMAEETDHPEMGQASEDPSCAGIEFEVTGLVLGALPEVSTTSAEISWADTVDRNNVDYFNTDLVKAIANNLGVADLGDVLGPLFARLGNGWFQQRESVSLMVEWPPLSVNEVLGSWDTLPDVDVNISKRYTGENDTTLRSGTIHQILRQGIGDDDFCDAQIDPWGEQVIRFNVYPWEQVGEFDTTEPTILSVSTSDLRNDVCVAGMEVYVTVLLNPEQANDGVIPSYSITLKNVNLDISVELSAQNFNPMFNGTFTPRESATCCQQGWCDPDIDPKDYNQGWTVEYDCPGQTMDITCTNVTWDPYCDALNETGGDISACDPGPCTIDRCDFGMWDECEDIGCGGSGCDDSCGYFDDHQCQASWAPRDTFLSIDTCEPDTAGTGYAFSFNDSSNSASCRAYFEDSLTHSDGTTPVYFTASQANSEPDVWRDLGIARCYFNRTCGTQSYACSSMTTNCTGVAGFDSRSVRPSRGGGGGGGDHDSHPHQHAERSSGTTCYDFPPAFESSLSQPTQLCFSADNTPTFSGLGQFENEPLAGEWQLILETEDGEIGSVIDWQLAFEMENCNAQTPPEVCAFGEGTESFQPGSDVSIMCPDGTIIVEVVDARMGWPEMGTCGDAITAGSCDFDNARVKEVIENECLYSQSCEFSSDASYWVSDGEEEADWLCPQVRCNDTTFELCDNPDLPFIKARVKCELVSSVVEITEVPPLMVTETNETTFPAALLVKSATGLFDAMVYSTNYVVEQRDDVLTLMAREGEHFNAIIKSVKSNPAGGFITEHFQYEWRTSMLPDGNNESIAVVDQITMVAGDFDGDRFGEVAVGWVDALNGELNLVLWDMHAVEMEDDWANKEDAFADITGMEQTFENAPHFVFDPEDVGFRITVMDVNATKTSDGKLGAVDTQWSSKGFAFDVAHGDLNFDLSDEAVVVWIDKDSLKVFLQVFELGYYEVDTDDYLETMVGRVFADDAATERFYEIPNFDNPHAVAVAVGDFEGTGSQEIAVAVSDESGIYVEFIRVDELRSFALSSVERFTARSAVESHLIHNYHNVKMAVGELNDDNRDELVVAYSTSQAVQFYVFTNAGSTDGSGEPCSTLECFEQRTGGSFRVGADINMDEVLAGNERILRPAEFHVDVANMDNTRAEEIVFAAEYNHANVNLDNLENEPATRVLLNAYAANGAVTSVIEQGTMCQVGPGYAVQPNVEDSTTRNDDQLNEYIQNKYIVSNLGFAAGNLYGLGLRVGAPDFIKVEGAPRLLAIVGAPPTHIDPDLEGGTIIINGGTVAGTDGSFCEMDISEGVTSVWEWTAETGDSTTTIGGAFTDAQLSVIQGQYDDQTNSIVSDARLRGNSNNTNLAINKALTASQDDVVMYTRTTADIWIYPIVDTDNVRIGTIEIEFPSSCGDDCIEVSNGRETRWYNPDHQVFNLLSYSTRSPSAFTPSGRIFVGDRVLMGTDGHEQYIDTQETIAQGDTEKDSKNTQEQTHWKVGGGIAMSIDTNWSPLGVGPTLQFPISVSAGYEKTDNDADIEYDNSTNKQANIAKSSSVHVTLEGIDPSHAYWVQPYLFSVDAAWQSEPYVVLDFVAEPFYEPGRYNFWQDTYHLPDLTFNLPYSWASLHRSVTQQTKEFVVDPLPPVEGDVVSVTWKIRNYSTREARGVRVYFWKGDPDNCVEFYCRESSQITVREITVPKQGYTEVTIEWIFDGIQNIYCTIDPDNEVPEIHENNNKAYNFIWVDYVPDPMGGPYGEYTFEVASLELGLDEFDSNGGFAPVYDTFGRIEAYDITVKVTGNTFKLANIPVLFFLGDPEDETDGGEAEMFTAESISLLPNNTDVYVTARWDVTELEGEQSIHVFLVHEGFEVDTDNTLDELVLEKEVGCYYGYDECGVCGGDDSSCRGCDGIINSGNLYDRCGVCAGDGSSCCNLAGTQGDDGINYIIIKENEVTNEYLEIFVGDEVVWENHDTELSHHIITAITTVNSLKILEDPEYGLSADLTELNELAQEIPQVAASGAAFANPDDEARRLRKRKAFPRYEGVGVKRRSAAPHSTSRASPPAMMMEGEDRHHSSLRSMVDADVARRSHANVPPGLAPYYSQGLVQPPRYTSIGDEYARSVMEPLPEDDLTDRAVQHSRSDPSAMRTIYQRRARMLHQQAIRQGRSGNARGQVVPFDGGAGNENARPRVNLNDLRPTTITNVVALTKVTNTISQTNVNINVQNNAGNDGLLDYIKNRDEQKAAADAAQEAEDNLSKVKWAKSLAVASIGGLSGLVGGVDGIGGSPISASSGFFGSGSAGRLVGGFDLNSIVRQPEEEAPEPALGPGKGSFTVPFPYAGAYHWADQDTDVIQGVIVVKYVPYVLDQCGVCNGDGTSCIDCQGVVGGSAILDSCDVCSNGTTGLIANADVDCNGVCFGTAVINECGQCVLGTTGREYNYSYDCNGVCFGNASLECGVCYDPYAPNATAPYDCMQVCNGTAYLDQCGICVEGTSGRGPRFSLDCNDDCFGFAEYDHCGDCRGGGTLLVPTPDDLPCPGIAPCGGSGPDVVYPDCNGVCNGTHYIDSRDGFCYDENGTVITTRRRSEAASAAVRQRQGSRAWYEQMDTHSSSHSFYARSIPASIDCNGVPIRAGETGAQLDSCGVCYGGDTGVEPNTLLDCNNVCNGTATFDDCAVCSGGDTGLIANADKDCAEHCFGTAFIDDCGQCVSGITGLEVNYAKDCAGQCFGDHKFDDDSCTCNGTLDECFVCDGDGTLCAGCDGVAWSGVEYDLCGVCGGDSSTCCFYEGEVTTISFTASSVQPSVAHTVTGGTIRVEHRMFEDDPPPNDIHGITLFQLNATWFPFETFAGSVAKGEALEFFISRPGHYVWSSTKFPVITGEIMVSFNTNVTDVCGVCGGDGSACCMGQQSCGSKGGCVLPGSEKAREREAQPSIVRIQDRSADPAMLDITTGSFVRFENYDDVEYFLAFQGPASVHTLRLRPFSTTQWQFHAPGSYFWSDPDRDVLEGYIHVLCDETSSSDMEDWEIGAIVAGVLFLVALAVLLAVCVAIIVAYALLRYLRTPQLITHTEMEPIRANTMMEDSEDLEGVRQASIDYDDDY